MQSKSKNEMHHNKLLQGRVIAWCTDVSAGVIKTPDGKKYLFPVTEWRTAEPPVNNMFVAFEPRSRGAMNVCAA